jgi:hypothetical protein
VNCFGACREGARVKRPKRLEFAPSLEPRLTAALALPSLETTNYLRCFCRPLQMTFAWDRAYCRLTSRDEGDGNSRFFPLALAPR